VDDKKEWGYSSAGPYGLIDEEGNHTPLTLDKPSDISKKQKKINKKYGQVEKVIQRLQQILLLSEWQIRLTSDKLPDYRLAEVGLHPTIRIADITFNKSMLGEHKKISDKQWLLTIIHEMIHIRLANTTHGIVYRTREVHKNKKMFFDEFMANVEPEIELLTNAIYELWDKEF